MTLRLKWLELAEGGMESLAAALAQVGQLEPQETEKAGQILLRVRLGDSL